MAFWDLLRDFEGSGTQLVEGKKPELMPMPRVDSLVNNDLGRLQAIPLETKKKIKFLFLLAHPDDEASHLVYLKMLTDLGFSVQVTWLTYGDGSTDIETKKEESTKVLSAIPGVQTKFLPNKVMDVVRGVFKEENKEKQEAALGQLIDQVRFEVRGATAVITNAFEGGHLLHDFTNLLAREVAVQQGISALEIPQYSVKTLGDMVHSAIKSLLDFQWGSHVFYNVGEFREGAPKEEAISIAHGDGNIEIPTKLELTNTAVTSKAGLIRLYESQWKSVFSKLLEAVEFNESEDKEYVRPAGMVPELYSGLLHLARIVKSWLGMGVHPKKLYEVKSQIETIVKTATAENAQR